ncbi:hypothetical protein, partial [Pseudoalteromonas sp.]|uniref:hypothetical protein n=1 Tax=Pseudoalteromonas sp. TaxID=53249 RepID=UPI00260DAC79
MPTWARLLEALRYGFCSCHYWQGGRDLRQCCQDSKCKILTVKLPINARAECQLGARLLGALQYGFCSCHYWQGGRDLRQCCQDSK